MSHTIVFTRHFARSKPHPIGTIETTDPDFNDILSAIKMDEYIKARQSGREKPIITTEFVDHSPPVLVPLIPPSDLVVDSTKNAHKK